MSDSWKVTPEWLTPAVQRVPAPQLLCNVAGHGGGPQILGRRVCAVVHSSVGVADVSETFEFAASSPSPAPTSSRVGTSSSTAGSSSINGDSSRLWLRVPLQPRCVLRRLRALVGGHREVLLDVLPAAAAAVAAPAPPAPSTPAFRTWPATTGSHCAAASANAAGTRPPVASASAGGFEDAALSPFTAGEDGAACALDLGLVRPGDAVVVELAYVQVLESCGGTLEYAHCTAWAAPLTREASASGSGSSAGGAGGSRPQSPAAAPSYTLSYDVRVLAACPGRVLRVEALSDVAVQRDGDDYTLHLTSLVSEASSVFSLLVEQPPLAPGQQPPTAWTQLQAIKAGRASGAGGAAGSAPVRVFALASFAPRLDSVGTGALAAMSRQMSHPPSRAASHPLDLWVMVDCSAPMAGAPLAQAREAAHAVLQALPPRQPVWLTLVAFGGEGRRRVAPRVRLTGGSSSGGASSGSVHGGGSSLDGPSAAHALSSSRAWIEAHLCHPDLGRAGMLAGLQYAYGVPPLVEAGGRRTLLLITGGACPKAEHDPILDLIGRGGSGPLPEVGPTGRVATAGQTHTVYVMHVHADAAGRGAVDRVSGDGGGGGIGQGLRQRLLDALVESTHGVVEHLTPGEPAAAKAAFLVRSVMADGGTAAGGTAGGAVADARLVGRRSTLRLSPHVLPARLFENETTQVLAEVVQSAEGAVLELQGAVSGATWAPYTLSASLREGSRGAAAADGRVRGPGTAAAAAGPAPARRVPGEAFAVLHALRVMEALLAGSSFMHLHSDGRPVVPQPTQHAVRDALVQLACAEGLLVPGVTACAAVTLQRDPLDLALIGRTVALAQASWLPWSERPDAATLAALSAAAPTPSRASDDGNTAGPSSSIAEATALLPSRSSLPPAPPPAPRPKAPLVTPLSSLKQLTPLSVRPAAVVTAIAAPVSPAAVSAFGRAWQRSTSANAAAGGAGAGLHYTPPPPVMITNALAAVEDDLDDAGERSPGADSDGDFALPPPPVLQRVSHSSVGTERSSHSRAPLLEDRGAAAYDQEAKAPPGAGVEALASPLRQAAGGVSNLFAGMLNGAAGLLRLPSPTSPMATALPADTPASPIRNSAAAAAAAAAAAERRRLSGKGPAVAAIPPTASSSSPSDSDSDVSLMDEELSGGDSAATAADASTSSAAPSRQPRPDVPPRSWRDKLAGADAGRPAGSRPAGSRPAGSRRPEIQPERSGGSRRRTGGSSACGLREGLTGGSGSSSGSSRAGAGSSRGSSDRDSSSEFSGDDSGDTGGDREAPGRVLAYLTEQQDREGWWAMTYSTLGIVAAGGSGSGGPRGAGLGGGPAMLKEARPAVLSGEQWMTVLVLAFLRARLGSCRTSWAGLESPALAWLCATWPHDAPRSAGCTVLLAAKLL